jgi:hypothetical protein
VWTGDEPPVAARFTVYRKDWPHPVHAVAHFREYVQTTKDGTPTTMWANMPAGQIGKCAEALARRKAFPRRLSGVYIDEELQHLDNPQPAPMVIESQREEVIREPDWEVLIHDAEWAASRDKLAKVWALAKGMKKNDAELLNRIAEAGERIKAANAAQGNEGEPSPGNEEQSQ